ncbi:MAG TPA: helix-turn-helix transcriptional regulator [Planktothrix sp.]|jgi:predicted XRE-type DNA-binding protein
MSKLEIIESSGNVFRDLGFDEQESEELMIKSQLFHRLQDAIRGSKLTQVAAAKILGTDQSKVSKILRGQIADYSLDRITSYLLKLGWEVRVEACPPRKKTAKSAAGTSSRKEQSVAHVSTPKTKAASKPRR